MKENETMMNNGVTEEKLEGQEKRVCKEWVFIPLLKTHILSRKPTYVLFDIDGVASGIVNAKFIRKKESETMIYLSLPAEYEVNCNVREKIEGRWTTTKKYVITARELRPLVLEYNRTSVPNDKLPF